MRRMQQTRTVVLIALASANAAMGGENADARKKLARFREIRETVIETTGFPEEMPLSKFLAALHRQLPRDKKIALRLEETELGKEACRLADAPVRCSGLRTTLSTLLRKAMRQAAADVDLDCDIREDGIVITRASALVIHSSVYPAADVVREMPSLLPSLKRFDPDLFVEDVDSSDGLALLVRYLTFTCPLRPREKIEILDRTRLAVRASIHGQDAFADTLQALRYMSDNAVIMNARLYEVDRDFFRKQVAPLFVGERPALVAIDDGFLKKIVRHRLIQESEDRKLRPNARSMFLSRHSVFRYNAGRNAKGDPRPGSGLAGVSFEVRPIVSADRRFLRLHVTQHVAQLVKIDKSKMLDPATGKDGEIETPNVRKSTVSGTIQILDAGAILMPVHYRPADDRVWLLVARPYIWIEAEEKERGPGNQTTSKGVWNSGVPKEGEPPPAVPPPGKSLSLDDDDKAILQAVLTDVLTNPELADTRKSYGTPVDKTLVLADGDLGWPKDFSPNLHGYRIVPPVRSDPFQEQRRILAIRLDKFDLKAKKSGPLEGPIEVCLFNAGGDANGAVIGGCSVYYEPKRKGKGWIVDCLGVLDP
jgi:hypothetical protein